MNQLFFSLNVRLHTIKRLLTILLVVFVLTFMVALFAAPTMVIEAGPATSDTYCSGC